jgi:hypothetical protein
MVVRFWWSPTSNVATCCYLHFLIFVAYSQICFYFVLQVVLKCDIKKDICYTKPNPKFHHWHIEDKRFGLTFERYNDAKAFDKGIRKAVADLTDGEYFKLFTHLNCKEINYRSQFYHFFS